MELGFGQILRLCVLCVAVATNTNGVGCVCNPMHSLSPSGQPPQSVSPMPAHVAAIPAAMSDTFERVFENDLKYAGQRPGSDSSALLHNQASVESPTARSSNSGIDDATSAQTPPPSAGLADRVVVCVLPQGTQLANGLRHLCTCGSSHSRKTSVLRQAGGRLSIGRVMGAGGGSSGAWLREWLRGRVPCRGCT